MEKTGLLNDQQSIDLQRYFLDVHERQANGEAFPFNLEELVPTVYQLKHKTVEALKKGYTQDFDFISSHGRVIDNPNPEVTYLLSAPTFEHMVAKKNRGIFEIYRRVFHTAAAEALKLPKPYNGGY